jgi:hypothetical protein
MTATIQFRIPYVPVLYPKSVKIKIHKTITLPVVLYGCEWNLDSYPKEMNTDWRFWERGAEENVNLKTGESK